MAVATSTQHPQHGHPQTPAPNADPGPSDHNQQWDGDRMFNVYIWDYCVKRGYNKTARELIEEAKLEQNPLRPIDAKQGLLYEWWTVFWYLFHAKSNNINQSTEDAVLYIQTRLAGNVGHPRFPPNGMRNMPGMGAPGVAGPNGGSPGQLPPNPTAPHAHGIPNGIGPSHPSQIPSIGHPSQQQQPPLQPPPLGFPGHVQHQPNGVAPQSGPRGSIVGPPMPGQPPRAPGPGFYQQSPTMAHPHTPTGGPPPYPGPNPNAMGGQVPPNGYPQPMRNMPPPGSQPNGVANASSPGFAQGNSGSRAPTPAQQTQQPGAMTQPSPRMANRVPQTPPNFGVSQGMAVPARGVPFEVILQELQRIDPMVMNELRNELGLGMKELTAMSPDEKNRLFQASRQRQSSGQGGGPQQRQGRGAKRSSTSPGEEHAEIPPKDGSSPPAQKKVRASHDQAMPPSSALPPGGNAVGQMFPQNGPSGALRAGPSFAPQMGSIPPGVMMHGMGPNHMPPGVQPPKGNIPFPGNAPMNKMPGPETQHYGPDANQPRSAPPPFQPGNPLRPQGKPGPNSMPPPNSPASAGKPQPKMEGVGNSPLTAPPSSSGSVGARNPSPATPVMNSNQVNASAPSPSAVNLSRPGTASSNPPHTAPPGSGTTTGIGAPPAPASAPPGPTDAPSLSAFAPVDFITSDFDNFTNMFGRDDQMTFESDFQSWFGADMSLPDIK